MPAILRRVIVSVFETYIAEDGLTTFTGAFVLFIRAIFSKRRTDEAVSRKCEDFRRAIRTYLYLMGKWKEKADVVGDCRGKRAYAFKKAAMWKAKADRLEAAYNSARRPEYGRDQLDHTRVRLRY